MFILLCLTELNVSLNCLIAVCFQNRMNASFLVFPFAFPSEYGNLTGSRSLTSQPFPLKSLMSRMGLGMVTGWEHPQPEAG